jgi:hypothetical protein
MDVQLSVYLPVAAEHDRLLHSCTVQNVHTLLGLHGMLLVTTTDCTATMHIANERINTHARTYVHHQHHIQPSSERCRSEDC